MLILNAQRQIISASTNVQELIGKQCLDTILGLRPGEALSCIHAHEQEAGCGTSASCRECGLIDVILSGLDGQVASRQCRLMRLIHLAPEPADFLVQAKPFELDGERFTAFSFRPASQRAAPEASGVTG